MVSFKSQNHWSFVNIFLNTQTAFPQNDCRSLEKFPAVLWSHNPGFDFLRALFSIALWNGENGENFYGPRFISSSLCLVVQEFSTASAAGNLDGFFLSLLSERPTTAWNDAATEWNFMRLTVQSGFFCGEGKIFRAWRFMASSSAADDDDDHRTAPESTGPRRGMFNPD